MVLGWPPDNRANLEATTTDSTFLYEGLNKESKESKGSLTYFISRPEFELIQCKTCEEAFKIIALVDQGTEKCN